LTPSSQWDPDVPVEKILQEKAVEATEQKEEKRKKLKPEEKEGMPQHEHCHA
jgi:hypothetical protein